MSTSINRASIRIVLAVGIAILFSVMVQAQQQRMTVEDRVTILKQALKLSNEQSNKITIILEDQREEITTSMNENRGNRNAMQAARKEIMNKTNEKIKSVLTEDQIKTYDGLLKGRRARAKQRIQDSGK
jgi:hypothetical protein